MFVSTEVSSTNSNENFSLMSADDGMYLLGVLCENGWLLIMNILCKDIIHLYGSTIYVRIVNTRQEKREIRLMLPEIICFFLSLPLINFLNCLHNSVVVMSHVRQNPVSNFQLNISQSNNQDTKIQKLIFFSHDHISDVLKVVKINENNIPIIFVQFQ